MQRVAVAHDAVVARLDEALADTESRLQFLNGEGHSIGG
jgi:hypothetical protein